MVAFWLRCPRYGVLVAVALLTILCLFQSDSGPTYEIHYTNDSNLHNRVERAKQIYNKMLQDRTVLLQKFGGGDPDKIDIFPPNVSPWPPYTVWDFFPPAFNCPHEVERLGALGHGGKWVCGISRLEEKKECVIYSFGVGFESSFEAEILARTEHCQIWGYDFSVPAFGPDIPKNSIHRTHFTDAGLSGLDKASPSDDPKIYSLNTLMKNNGNALGYQEKGLLMYTQKLGHTHIDILKINIEGSEFETLATLLHPYIDSGRHLPFGQLLLEIHLWNNKKTFAEFLRWWEILETAGLRPFRSEPNLVYQNYNIRHTADLAEYSFLNIRGENVFIVEKSPKGHPHAPPS